MDTKKDSREIIAIQTRLAELETERNALQRRLRELKSSHKSGEVRIANETDINAASLATEKIALFRRLFAGREMAYRIHHCLEQLEKR